MSTAEQRFAQGHNSSERYLGADTSRPPIASSIPTFITLSDACLLVRLTNLYLASRRTVVHRLCTVIVSFHHPLPFRASRKISPSGLVKEEPSSPSCFGSFASEVLPPRESEGDGRGNKMTQSVSELTTEYLHGI